jgi:hypothetical protein
MKDVVHRARSGQGSDPSTARALLSQFIDAAYALSAGWDPALDPGYPRHLPSFDEFVTELHTWKEEVDERQEVAEDEDIRPLNFANPVEVQAWLKRVRSQVEDAVTAGEDATRPLGKRALGRLMARRMLIEARHALLELLQAAERGIS